MGTTRDIPLFTDAASSHPFAIRALNRIGDFLPVARELRAEAIWDAARTGELADREPTREARVALDALIDSLSESVRLNLVGWASARDDTTRLARTHLRIHRALEACPEVAATQLPPALFIVGWPRTGSTFLHQLLAQDPVTRSIPYWESFDPVPPTAGRPDLRIQKLERMLKLLERIEPRYHAIHPMEAESAEECVALFMNEFRTLQLDIQYRVPAYVEWLLAQDASVAYASYKRQLELIHFHRKVGKRQILKDPTHLVHLATLLKEFPDAKFVFTHRDPAVAISSICSLVAYTRALFSDAVDPRAIGAEIMAGYWPTALEAGRRLRGALPEGRAVDVRHSDLVRDPIETVASIYRGLGLELSEPAREAMLAFVEDQHGEARHYHALESFGLRAGEVRGRFADYCQELEL